MSTQIPSPYQEKIYDFITNGIGNAVISAKAGAGKTSVLVKSLELIPKYQSVSFMAFNKSIATELKERIPKGSTNIDVQTVHGYGYSILKNKLLCKIDKTNLKYKKILRDILIYCETDELTSLKPYHFGIDEMIMIEDFRFEESESKIIENKTEYSNRIVALCDLGRLNLIDLDNQENGIKSLEEIALKHNIEVIGGESLRAWFLIKIGASYTKVIDFTDMIFLPNYLSFNCKQYDFVLIDECQDLNVCQRELMLKSIRRFNNEITGRFIAVGDERQAIYGFCGSDSESFCQLLNIPNTIKLPLSVCYRCPTDVIEFVKEQIPNIDIEASPNAKKGLIDNEFSYHNVKAGDLVICRNTMPLVSLCMKYLSKGVKAFVMGTDVSANLIAMVNSCRDKHEYFSIENIFSKMEQERERLISNIMTKENVIREDAINSGFVMTYTDKLMTLRVLSENCFTGYDLIEKLKSIFSDKSDGICLATIHKSKGLEANRVFIIHKDLMPSIHAKQDWEKEQEVNLKYVAYTRTKDVLGFISDFNAFDDILNYEKGNKSNQPNKFSLEIGSELNLTLTIRDVKEINTSYGITIVYEMADDKGNLFSKFGIIPNEFIISEHQSVQIGCKVSFFAKIKNHNYFNRIKTHVLSKIEAIKVVV